MSTHQVVPMGQINPAFPPHNPEDIKLQTPDQGPSSTVIHVHSYEAPPKDFLVWSVFNTLYMNFCCLGFMALIFSVKSRDRKVVGDLHGAQSYGSIAKWLNICALIFSLLLVIVLIILLAMGIILVGQVAMSQHK